MYTQYIPTYVTVCICKEAETLNAVYYLYSMQTQPMIDTYTRANMTAYTMELACHRLNVNGHSTEFVK